MSDATAGEYLWEGERVARWLAQAHGLALRPWPDALAEMLDAVLAGTESRAATPQLQRQSGSP